LSPSVLIVDRSTGEEIGLMNSVRHGLRRSRYAAFTLVELLVVIAIIGILVALLLPAVQAAREAARRTQCVNHLKQLSLGAMNHESARKLLPSGGWGWRWVGDADRGSGAEQPGSWFYNILPFIEEQALHDMPKDGKPEYVSLNLGDANDPQLRGAQKMVFSVPPAMFHCPSRRPAQLYKIEAHHPEIAMNAQKNDSGTDYYVGAADYAANAGDGSYIEATDGGVPGWIQGKTATGRAIYRLNMDNLGLETRPNGDKIWRCTGVIFQESEVGLKHIIDGASKTYLIGERNLDPLNYNRDKSTPDGGSSVDGSDSWGWAWGFCADNQRSGLNPPLVDYPNVSAKDRFGAAHPGGWHVAFCDGSVDSISYDIDLLVHQNNANRRDSGRSVAGEKTF
jgi:prepilin-type N-terminal cleavage/methylation domain-containing protein